VRNDESVHRGVRDPAVFAEAPGADIEAAARVVRSSGRACAAAGFGRQRAIGPWGGNLPELLESPHPTLGLLEKLHRDPSDYVRLSISNHLNDFSKHHPELVIETLSRWQKANPDDPRLAKLARHACRTLLKSGHPGALEFHGYGSAKALELEVFALGKSRSCWAGSWTTGSSSAIPRDVPSR